MYLCIHNDIIIARARCRTRSKLFWAYEHAISKCSTNGKIDVPDINGFFFELYKKIVFNVIEEERKATFNVELFDSVCQSSHIRSKTKKNYKSNEIEVEISKSRRSIKNSSKYIFDPLDFESVIIVYRSCVAKELQRK